MACRYGKIFTSLYEEQYFTEMSFDAVRERDVIADVESRVFLDCFVAALLTMTLFVNGTLTVFSLLQNQPLFPKSFPVSSTLRGQTTSFTPNFPNKTTSVAWKCDINHRPHYRIKSTASG
jgi:hypothetical protein